MMNLLFFHEWCSQVEATVKGRMINLLFFMSGEATVKGCADEHQRQCCAHTASFPYCTDQRAIRKGSQLKVLTLVRAPPARSVPLRLSR